MIKSHISQWSKLGERMLSPDSITTMAIGLFHVSLLICLLFWHWNSDFTKEFLLPYLSMLGSVAAAFATFMAAVVALGIARWQDEMQRKRQAVACLHHAIAIINDLRGRLDSMARQLTEGGRPFVALTLNAEFINKRAETLFDREIYVHLPGPIVDRITGMQGSFFGLQILIAALETKLNLQKHDAMPKTPADAVPQITASIARLDNDLDAMLTDLFEVRRALDED